MNRAIVAETRPSARMKKQSRREEMQSQVQTVSDKVDTMWSIAVMRNEVGADAYMRPVKLSVELGISKRRRKRPETTMTNVVRIVCDKDATRTMHNDVESTFGVNTAQRMWKEHRKTPGNKGVTGGGPVRREGGRAACGGRRLARCMEVPNVGLPGHVMGAR